MLIISTNSYTVSFFLSSTAVLATESTRDISIGIPPNASKFLVYNLSALNEGEFNRTCDVLLQCDDTRGSIRSNLKQIVLENWEILACIQDSEEDSKSDENLKLDIKNYTKLLDILLPLSPQEKKLKQRLETEITDEVRRSKTLLEIEKLENKIKQEVESHYNTFDANELSYNDNNINNKNKKKNGKKHTQSWISPREMIGMIECDVEVPSSIVMEKIQFKSRIEPNRIQSTLTNVKCLQFEVSMLDHDGDENLIEEILLALINNLANQLTSLHIERNDKFDYLKNWKFFTFYPGTKDKLQAIRKQPWYPLNVQELCIHSTSSRMNGSDYFWNIYVSSQSFPNLKRLKITNDVNDSIYKIFSDAGSDTRDRMSSLIGNGLQLLHLKLIYPDHCYFIPGFDTNDDATFDPCQSVKFLKNVFDYGNILIMNEFVLKLEFHVKLLWSTVRKKDKKKMKSKLRSKQLKQLLTKIVCQVESLFFSMDCHLHGDDDIMVAFRIVFHVDDDTDNSLGETIKDTVQKSKCLKQIKIESRGNKRIVDTSVKTSKYGVVVAVVWKRKNRSRSNEICDLCYTDPKFGYDCQYCKLDSWMT